VGEEKRRPHPLRRLAVIGAGNMGSGIAQKIAAEGFPVILVDVNKPQVERGLKKIAETLAEGVERRLFTAAQAEAIRGRIKGSTEILSVADCDLVVEAVFEDLALKRQIFHRLDLACDPKTILATNTSSFSVTELAAVTRRPGRCVGLHYFYHPAKNRLVEVVPGEVTSEATRQAAWRFQELLGKTPIHSEDAPGFIVNRYFVPWLNEAVRLLEEGVAGLATIERAAVECFGVRMGPFELMNVTGMPIALHAATTLGRKLGPLYAPAPALAAQVESGVPWDLAAGSAAGDGEVVAARLLGVVFLVAGQLLDEGVCSLEDCDIGARVGLRWPRGPFELMNRRGLAEAVALARAAGARHGVELPESMAEQAAAGRPFRFQVIKSEVADGIATLTVNRPDALNSLNPEVVAQLGEAFEAAAARADVRAIVLAGAGKAFVAGADIRFFLRHLESGDLSAIRSFTEAAQELLRRIDGSAKPVLARLEGLALGGGSELALACHAIIASERGSIGFPETGIGIYPGLGGTQRTPRRTGVGVAKYLVLTGETVPAEEAVRIGLVDEFVPAAEIGEAVKRRAAAARGGGGPPADLPEPWRRREAFFMAHRVDELLNGRPDTGGDPDLERAVQLVRRKAPAALRLAERLIEEGARVPLEQGLAMELAHLEEIFRTRDAREGLSSVGVRRPVFQGQ